MMGGWFYRPPQWQYCQITKLNSIMSQEIDKETPPNGNQSPNGDSDPNGNIGCISAIISILIFLFLFGMCVRGCNDSGDDTWGTLQHHVDSDPYYKQW